MPEEKAWILVENTGELELKLLELMGASTKDGTDSIGIFGTGWKYGLALALRNNIDVIVFSGTEKIQFSTLSEVVRDTTFQRIALSVNGKRRKKTSMTTRMGEKDWKDEWYFLREIMANAIDEGGFQIRRVPAEESPVGLPETTRVYISETPRLEEVLGDMEYYVRRSGAFEENEQGKMFKPLGDKCRIYKQGLFVKELSDKSAFDYDLTNLKLTESRSADSYEILWEMKKCLNKSSVEVKKTILMESAAAHQDEIMLVESDLDLSGWNTSESEVEQWSATFTNTFGEDSVLCSNSEIATKSVANLGYKPVTLPERVAKVLRDGKKVKTEDTLVGKGALQGYIYREATKYEQDILDKSKVVLALVLGDIVNDFPVCIFTEESKNTDEIVYMLKEKKKTSMLMHEKCFTGGLRKVIGLQYKEYIKWIAEYSDERDESLRKMEKALVENILPSLGVLI